MTRLTNYIYYQGFACSFPGSYHKISESFLFKYYNNVMGHCVLLRTYICGCLHHYCQLDMQNQSLRRKLTTLLEIQGAKAQSLINSVIKYGIMPTNQKLAQFDLTGYGEKRR